jgi:glycogen phosphorylase
MEIALHPEVHTYSGGLGVLAGDILSSCADLRVPIVGLTLLYRNGFFTQALENGDQVEHDEPWDVERFTVPLPEGRQWVIIEGREVWVEPRVGILVGQSGHSVPIILLDTDLDVNDPQDRSITANLYGGDHKHRLKQEAILGIGGQRALRKLDVRHGQTFHLNEGHGAFAPMEDVRYLGKYYRFNQPAIQTLVRSKHVFTTHTPVPAGHDRFTYEELRSVLGEHDFAWDAIDLGGHHELNMTKLALNLSRYSNAVAKKHRQVSKEMFPGYEFDSVTNGVHLPSWMHPGIQAILDDKMPSWREEPSILEHCYQVVEHDELWQAHMNAKRELLAFVKERTGRELREDLLTVGFARRFATYKRADLVFRDIKRLKELAKGRMQFVFAGEAHPRDSAGKEIIKRVIEMSEQLRGEVDVVFLEDYDMDMARVLLAGCDLWQNNPVPPKEASGTSGMKAAANGVPNLSTLDGWWIEGITKNPQAGWIIQHRPDGKDELSLYERYGHICRVYYDHPDRWKEHMVHALSLAHYFNTHRVVQEYQERAWTVKLY